VKGILESDALEPDDQKTPKDIWFNEELLQAWMEQRRKRRLERTQKPEEYAG